MTNIPINERQNFIGASEVSALFGLHPQLTKFELWHIKKGNLPPADLSANERVMWGNHLEPAIAKGIAELHGWKIRRVRRYLVNPRVPGMGASLDYEILNYPGYGTIPFEIKNVDGLVFKDWDEEEAPIHMQLQVQSQLACSKDTCRAAMLGVLVGGNRAITYGIDRREKTIRRIEMAVQEFWQSIADDHPPSPTFETDSDAVLRLYKQVDPGSFETIDDSYVERLLQRYCEARDIERAAFNDKMAARAEIMTHIGRTETVVCGSYRVTNKNGFRVYERRDSEEEGAPFEFDIEAMKIEAKGKKTESLRDIKSIF